MKSRSVIYAEQAEEDFQTIYRRIEQVASGAVADRYLDRLQDFCEHLDLASERGQMRPDIMPGLRTVGFERRTTIAFVVEQDTVRILRLFGEGRDWEAKFP